jgi:hypothetical protein
MATSQNGWLVTETSTGLDKTFAPVAMPNGVRSGDVAAVLGYVARQFHDRVENLLNGWCWGWAYRAIRGQESGYSNHASGTAVDFNAPRHPLGVRNTFTADQRDEIHKILNEVGNVVRWGGDYSGRVDEMHFEINASAAVVAATAGRLRAPAPPADDLMEEEPMIVPASKDDYVSVPCNGKTSLFISSAFGRTVTVLNIAAVKDANGKNTPEYTSVQKGIRDINPDQPGPIALGGGCRVVQLRYSADHDFTVWCA